MDLYSDDYMPAGGEEATEAEDSPKEEGDGKGSDDSPESTLPKSILAGKEFNVGDEVVLEITGMHDNEITVRYAQEKGEDKSRGEDEGGEGKASMPKGMDEGSSGLYD